MPLRNLGALVVGIIVGFLGGLFGKGGSAIATPMLSLLGFPGFVAIAAPLPATVPGTLIASAAYWRSSLLDWQIIRWSIGVGVPATIIGSYLTAFVGARPLLIATALLVLGFGASFLLAPGEKDSPKHAADNDESIRPPFWHLRLVLVSLVVGVVSGLLANSGGFLLAPSYARILREPIKKAFACSLAVSAVLALPGTVIHARLGHISWGVTGLIAIGSVPLSYLGAKVAIHTKAKWLERLYGLLMTGLGLFFLFRV